MEMKFMEKMAKFDKQEIVRQRGECYEMSCCLRRKNEAFCNKFTLEINNQQSNRSGGTMELASLMKKGVGKLKRREIKETEPKRRRQREGLGNMKIRRVEVGQKRERLFDCQP